MLSKITTIYINLPNYYMVKLGNERLKTDGYDYKQISLPLLNDENIMRPHMITYNIKAVILHITGVHFMALIHKPEGWVFFDDENVVIQTESEKEDKIKQFGQYLYMK